MKTIMSLLYFKIGDPYLTINITYICTKADLNKTKILSMDFLVLADFKKNIIFQF